MEDLETSQLRNGDGDGQLVEAVEYFQLLSHHEKRVEKRVEKRDTHKMLIQSLLDLRTVFIFLKSKRTKK